MNEEFVIKTDGTIERESRKLYMKRFILVLILLICPIMLIAQICQTGTVNGLGFVDLGLPSGTM